MDDLSNRIQQILNDPQSVQLLQTMAQNLGLSTTATTAAAPSMDAALPPVAPSAAANTPVNLNSLNNMLSQLGLGQLGQQGNPLTSPPASASLPPIDMNNILQIQKAMSLFANGNKNVDLLRSLRPLLSQQRQKKVDDAVRIMQLVQMLPMLKEAGLFGSPGGAGQ